MSNELFVTACTVGQGEHPDVTCEKREITPEELDRYTAQLKDCLLKVAYTKTRSYDNGDDERSSCNERTWTGVKYCEIDPEENSRFMIVRDDTVIGVLFEITDNRDRKKTRVFLFDGSVEQTVRMGYSASHSSEWTYIDRVTLVKRGEEGVPEKGDSLSFKQSEMYPSI